MSISLVVSEIKSSVILNRIYISRPSFRKKIKRQERCQKKETF